MWTRSAALWIRSAAAVARLGWRLWTEFRPLVVELHPRRVESLTIVLVASFVWVDFAQEVPTQVRGGVLPCTRWNLRDAILLR